MTTVPQRLKSLVHSTLCNSLSLSGIVRAVYSQASRSKLFYINYRGHLRVLKMFIIIILKRKK